MHTFSAVKQPKPLERKLRRRKKAVYRRIKKYYKSINQYKKERLRRKLCWLLTARFTQSEIAEMLGISRRTVIRDLDKIEPYYRRLNTNFWRKVNAEQKEEIEKKLKGKSPIAQFRILTNAMIEQFERFKGREYKRHYQIILLDLSQTDEYGIPKLQFIPRGHQTLAFPYEIAVHVKGVYEGNRFTAKLGGFTLTQTSGWR